MSGVAPRSATLEDFLAIPDGQRFHELVGGEIVRRASPSGAHGDAQAGVVAAIRPRFHRSGGGDGGWWILTEVEVLLPTREVVRPDVAGWRRTTCPERPTAAQVSVRPDWVCEVVSESNANQDTVKKLRLYHREAIPHYWLVDPRDQTLTVLRWSPDGYVTVLRAERGEAVRAEPFVELELHVGTLFGDDAPEPR